MGRSTFTPLASALAALGLALTLSACGGEAAENAEAQAQTRGPAADARTVRVARVETRPVEAGLAVSGLLVAREEAAVGTEVVGYRVADVLADE
ncbi:MAG TPA: efflux RND transporter periplasmic adaptor subunit, partial [Caulobacteraceae bacterium]